MLRTTLVAFEAKAAAPARHILERFGVGLNDAANGLIMKGASHAKIHTAAYYRVVNARLDAAKSGDDVLEILGLIRDAIGAGKFPP